MERMSFNDWFEQRYRRRDEDGKQESKHTALTRLSLAAELEVKTLYRALAGKKISTKTVTALRTIAGEGVLDVDAMLIADAPSCRAADADPETNGSAVA